MISQIHCTLLKEGILKLAGRGTTPLTAWHGVTENLIEIKKPELVPTTFDVGRPRIIT